MLAAAQQLLQSAQRGLQHGPPAACMLFILLHAQECDRRWCASAETQGMQHLEPLHLRSTRARRRLQHALPAVRMLGALQHAQKRDWCARGLPVPRPKPPQHAPLVSMRAHRCLHFALPDARMLDGPSCMQQSSGAPVLGQHSMLLKLHVQQKTHSNPSIAGCQQPVRQGLQRVRCDTMTYMPPRTPCQQGSGGRQRLPGGAALGARLRKQRVVRQHKVGRAAEVAVCQVLERPEPVVGPAHPAAQHRYVGILVDAVHPDARAHLHAARAVQLAVPQPRCGASQELAQALALERSVPQRSVPWTCCSHLRWPPAAHALKRVLAQISSTVSFCAQVHLPCAKG